MDWAAHAPEWVTIALVVGAFLFARRFGSGSALAELERSNRVLTRQVHELRQTVTRLEGENATLKARTDVAIAVAPVLDALRTHEVAAGQRAEAMLTVLGEIAALLGPDRD